MPIFADHFQPVHPQYAHLLMATSSKITQHLTKLKSSQTGFLNTTSSLYSNGLHSLHIFIMDTQLTHEGASAQCRVGWYSLRVVVSKCVFGSFCISIYHRHGKLLCLWRLQKLRPVRTSSPQVSITRKKDSA